MLSVFDRERNYILALNKIDCGSIYKIFQKIKRLTKFNLLNMKTFIGAKSFQDHVDVNMLKGM